MKPILTVITSTYNKGDRNRESIQSILDQTYQNFEYIVVDDQSPDNTQEILSEFKDSRLRIIRQENKGFVKTMISVMEQIDTPYVAIQGAGDISLPDRFEKQMRLIESRPDVGIVSCVVKSKADFARENGRTSYKTVEYDTVEQMIEKNIINHGEVVMRTEAYRKAGGYREFFHYVQDYDLWLRILADYSTVKLNEILYVKVSDAKFDVFGNPHKVEKQSLYALFAKYLAQQRLLNGTDPLEVDRENAFENFVREMNQKDKDKVAVKIFRNVVESQYEIDKAIRIIQKYSPRHPSIQSLRRLNFLKSLNSSGGEVYFRYYKAKAKVRYVSSKILEIFSAAVTKLIPT